MKLRFVWVGKTRQGPVKALVDDYLSRVERFARVEVIELRDRDAAGGAAQAVEKEGEEILARVAQDPFVTALDERGRQFGSAELAAFIDRHRTQGTRQMTFVLGGHQGLAEAVRRRADLLLGLSKMTLTHEMARALLLEQVYRAYTIIHDLPYQK